MKNKKVTFKNELLLSNTGPTKSTPKEKKTQKSKRQKHQKVQMNTQLQIIPH